MDNQRLGKKLRDAVVPRGPKSVAEPEKELRFTRVVQGRLFFGVAVVLLAVGLGVLFLATQDWGMEGPLLAGWWWLGALSLLACYGVFRLGLRCVRNAYVILSPLGVEIFPFFNARENLQVIYWTEVVDAEVSPGARQLVLHLNEEKTRGVVLSLAPIPVDRRHLLEEAVLGVLEKRDAGG